MRPRVYRRWRQRGLGRGHRETDNLLALQPAQQPVKVGFREGDMVQVHSLILQPGDKVVTTGAYGLSEKTRISVINE